MSNVLIYMLTGVGAALAGDDNSGDGRRTIGAVMLGVGLNHIVAGLRKGGA